MNTNKSDVVFHFFVAFQFQHGAVFQGEAVGLKGNEEVEYDGEVHNAANLFDALKEGYYGKF